MELYNLNSFEPFRISDKVYYENQFIEVRNILINEDDKKAKEIKLKYKKRFLKILNYNTILFFLSYINYDNVYTSFKNKIKEAVHNDDDDAITTLLEKLQLQTKTYVLAEQQKLEGVGETENTNNSIINTLELLFEDFVEIFYKSGKKVAMIEIPNKEIALITTIMFSLSPQIRTSYPFSKEGTLRDLCHWRKMALNNKQLNKMPGTIVENEISLGIPQETESQESNTTYITYAAGAPFCSHITGFNALPFYVLGTLPEKSVTAVSATIPAHLIPLIKEEYDDKINFLKVKSNISKINKLYFFTFDLNYYQNLRVSWRKMWENFGNFFYNEIPEKSATSLGDDDCTYGLMLAPTNRIAEVFYKTNIPSSSQHFSLIKGSWERFFSASFNKKGSQEASYCLRIASIQSSLGAGLNLPNHKFLMIGADVFKPYSTLFKHKDIGTFDARIVDAYLQLVQGIGRIGRKSKMESENPEI